MKEIDDKLYFKLKQLGIIDDDSENVRSYNVGSSDYAQHVIQPWAIWIDWNLNSWDADIIKRILRTKNNTSRKEDYEKIIHICRERLRQIKIQTEVELNNIDFEKVE